MTEDFMPLLTETAKNQEVARVILVSSGGMYTQKLEYEDLNMEKCKEFDGQV